MCVCVSACAHAWVCVCVRVRTNTDEPPHSCHNTTSHTRAHLLSIVGFEESERKQGCIKQPVGHENTISSPCSPRSTGTNRYPHESWCNLTFHILIKHTSDLLHIHTPRRKSSAQQGFGAAVASRLKQMVQSVFKWSSTSKRIPKPIGFLSVVTLQEAASCPSAGTGEKKRRGRWRT